MIPRNMVQITTTKNIEAPSEHEADQPAPDDVAMMYSTDAKATLHPAW